MARTWILAAAVIGALGVGLGAFGAHGLADVLAATGRADTFETASRYQMYHALALLAVGWLADTYPGRLIQWAGRLFIAGVILFSGSLYLLAIFDLRFMGAVAPFGGAALIAGWVCMGGAVWRGLDSTRRA
jgi:uncharacterized membrane protein YgdD (TMEM256/DUF423 family)